MCVNILIEIPYQICLAKIFKVVLNFTPTTWGWNTLTNKIGCKICGNLAVFILYKFKQICLIEFCQSLRENILYSVSYEGKKSNINTIRKQYYFSLSKRWNIQKISACCQWKWRTYKTCFQTKQVKHTRTKVHNTR